MSIIKLVRYDIKLGLRTNLIKLFFLIGIMTGIDGITMYMIRNVEDLYHVKATVPDYICFVLGGPKHIPVNMFEMYEIPVLWLAPGVMIAYLVGYYAMTDLDTYGMQILIRSGSRIKWWLSKCIWNGFMVMLSYTLIYLGIIGIAVINDARFQFSLTPEIAMNVCNISELNGDNSSYMLVLLLMPLVVTLAISMLQMTLALIFSPIISFIISQSIIFLSTIFEYQFLIANYGMLSHYNVTCGSEINIRGGIFVCSITYLIAVVTGIIYFIRFDILSKDSGTV